MDKRKYRIWWSPIGGQDGEATIFAAGKTEAKTRALEEMRRHSDIGAYGCSEISDPDSEAT